MKKVLVLSGGALFGCVQIGVLKYISTLDFYPEIKHVCGTSTGALISFFIVLGFVPKDIEYLITHLDMKYYFNIDSSLIFTNYGCNDGSKIYELLKFILKKKMSNDDITFKEILDKTGYHLTITACCINNEKIDWVFSPDTYPDMSVLLAIRMSISIPGLFTPVIWNGLYMVDGGVYSNYRSDLYPDDIIYGVKNYQISTQCQIANSLDYITQVCNTSFCSWRLNEKDKNYTICFECNNLNIYNFNSTPDEMIKMIELGYQKASQFDWTKNIDDEFINHVFELVKNKPINLRKKLIAKIKSI